MPQPTAKRDAKLGCSTKAASVAATGSARGGRFTVSHNRDGYTDGDGYGEDLQSLDIDGNDDEEEEDVAAVEEIDFQERHGFEQHPNDWDGPGMFKMIRA